MWGAPRQSGPDLSLGRRFNLQPIFASNYLYQKSHDVRDVPTATLPYGRMTPACCNSIALSGSTSCCREREQARTLFKQRRAQVQFFQGECILSVQERIRHAIKLSAGNVILRAELAGMGSASRVSAVLKALQAEGMLIRIGTGVYAKTRKSSVTGSVIPAGSLETLATEALKKLGVSISAGRAATSYNLGKTTQLPGAFVANTGRRRISRKIEVGGRRLVYENDLNR